MAETNVTPSTTKKPARRARSSGARTRVANARGNQQEPNRTPNWNDEATPLPLAVALRGFNQIVSRFCGKYPDRGFSATIDEAIAYSRQLRQGTGGQKTMTAAGGNA